MKRIQTILIHFLGGVTKEESNKTQEQWYHFGQLDLASGFKKTADSLYGNEHWSKIMYDEICTTLNNLTISQNDTTGTV